MSEIKYTETVKLPTLGLLYEKNHPFHNKKEIMIRHLTAKDEDMLTTKSLIKSGELVNLLIKEIIQDKNVDLNTLYIGDKNAILIFSRIYSFGSEYKAIAPCKFCGSTDEYTFDISSVPVNFLQVEPVEPYTNLFEYKTSKGNVFVFKLMTQEISKLIEEDINSQLKFNKKHANYNAIEKNSTLSYYHTIHSINGKTEKKDIMSFLETMPIVESRELRKYIKQITPDVEFKKEIYCTNCGQRSEVDLEFNSSFFWADF